MQRKVARALMLTFQGSVAALTPLKELGGKLSRFNRITAPGSCNMAACLLQCAHTPLAHREYRNRTDLPSRGVLRQFSII